MRNLMILITAVLALGCDGGKPALPPVPTTTRPAVTPAIDVSNAVMAALEGYLDERIPPSLFGTKGYFVSASRKSDRTLTVGVIEPPIFTQEHLEAIQREFLPQYPGWRVHLECKSTGLRPAPPEREREPGLIVSVDTAEAMDRSSPPVPLSELVEQWQAEIARIREPWFGPLRRQFDYCMPRIPELIEALTPDQPVALVAVFDNHEGNTERTNFWVLHLGRPLSIGMHSDGQRRIGRSGFDIHLDRQGNVLAPEVRPAKTYATLVQWLVQDPSDEVGFGRYVSVGRGHYDVEETTWTIKFSKREVISDEQLRETELSRQHGEFPFRAKAP